MSCGCDQNQSFERQPVHNPLLDYDNPNSLNGKRILHRNGTALEIISPILNQNDKRLIGFTTRNSSGKLLRIFAEDVVRI